MPFSVCVWSTGSVTHPLARDLASKFPAVQDNQTSLIVSPGLKVLVQTIPVGYNKTV